MVALVTHAYTTEQHEHTAELWRRLLDTHVTTAYEERRGYQSYLETVTDEHLNALIFANGEETDDYYPVVITLVSYSDYGGSCLDAANVRYFREAETPGVNFGSGAHSNEYDENHEDALTHVCDSIVAAWRTPLVDANQLTLC